MIKELHAEDVMTLDPLVLLPDQSVKDAAKLFVENSVSSAAVIDDGRLVGVVSETDLIMQEVKLHFPTFIHFLDSYIYLEGLSRFESDLKKAVAASVFDVMTGEPKTALRETTVADIATLMEEKDIHCIPVLDEDERLVGMVTKSDIVRALARN